jgi:phasin
MAETTTPPKAKAKPSPETYETANFETPRLEAPKFGTTNEGPALFREFAEKSIAQAKQAYDKLKTSAEESTAVLEDTYQTAAKGVTAYNLKVIEAARANANATFDFASRFVAVKSLSEAVELSSTHARKQFEALATQSKELAELAQKVASDTAEPIKASVNSGLSKVA